MEDYIQIIENISSKMVKLSFMSSFSNIEEEKLIEEVTTTNYEKVMKILNNVKNYFEESTSEKEMINDLRWVLTKIQTHTLYTYDINDQSFITDKFSMENNEIKSFMDYLKDYSEEKEFQRRNRDTKVSHTMKIIKLDKKRFISKFSKRNKSVTNTEFEEFRKEQLLKEIKFEEDEIDLKIIGEKDFNIFKLESQVMRENVFPIIAKSSYTNTNTTDYLNTANLDCFLELARDGYKNVPYHNSMHAADVCQTILIMLTHSNIVEILHLTPIDVISLITASLIHDIGHPALNNTFQINNFSDVAITYNDKSVLENFHIAESFRILRREDANIFSKFDNNQYRNVRKRMIELVLSTDMISHAKIVGLIKNKLQLNGIQNGKNNNNLIDTDSPSLFDDQQEIMNFMIHTCDIGHNTKLFEVSYKWTYLLMNEFWSQGDMEKDLGMTVSFLCDRNTSDVPRNQIVFIKSIILPNLEVLNDILPDLHHFKTNIESNLNSWMKIFEEEKKLLGEK